MPTDSHSALTAPLATIASDLANGESTTEPRTTFRTSDRSLSAISRPDPAESSSPRVSAHDASVDPTSRLGGVHSHAISGVHGVRIDDGGWVEACRDLPRDVPEGAGGVAVDAGLLRAASG